MGTQKARKCLVEPVGMGSCGQVGEWLWEPGRPENVSRGCHATLGLLV